LVAPVTLSPGDHLPGLAPAIRRERLADIDLVFRELPLGVTARITFIAGARLKISREDIVLLSLMPLDTDFPRTPGTKNAGRSVK
jgi:hypothetical protein